MKLESCHQDSSQLATANKELVSVVKAERTQHNRPFGFMLAWRSTIRRALLADQCQDRQ